MNCLNCENKIDVVEIKKHITLVCDDCGFIMKCLDVKDDISNWRVVNPFDIEDRRDISK